MNERFRYRTVRGKNVEVDMLFAPYMMDKICQSTGIQQSHGVTANKIKKLFSGNNNQIQARINLLVRSNLLQKQRLKKTEVKRLYGSHFVRLGKKTYEKLDAVGGKRNIYLLGKMGKRILRGYGSFAQSFLMNKGKPKVKYVTKEVPVEKEILKIDKTKYLGEI